MRRTPHAGRAARRSSATTSSGSCRGSPRTATSSTSSNKARYFDAAAAQNGSNGIQIALTSTAPESPTDYFAGPVTVTATGPAGVALFRRLDDGDEILYTGPFVVSADGPHTVEFRAGTARREPASFVIDATNPLAPVIFTPPLPAPTTYTFGQVVNADYRCRDSGSGIKTCAGTVGATPVAERHAAADERRRHQDVVRHRDGLRRPHRTDRDASVSGRLGLRRLLPAGRQPARR